MIHATGTQKKRTGLFRQSSHIPAVAYTAVAMRRFTPMPFANGLLVGEFSRTFSHVLKSTMLLARETAGAMIKILQSGRAA